MSTFPAMKPDKPAPKAEPPIIVPDLAACKTTGVFECSREALVSALQIVTPAIEKRNTIPILGYVLIRASAKTVTVEGTDLDVTVQHTIGRAKGSKAAVAVCLPAFDLLSFAKAAAGETITFAVEATQTKITAGATRSLPTLPPSDFPVDRKYETPVQFQMEPGELREAIRVIRPAVSEEEARYYLRGMFFEPLGHDFMQITATDGHRLHSLKVNAPGIKIADLLCNVIVPTKTIDVVNKWLGHAVRAWKKSGVAMSVSIKFGAAGIDFAAGQTVIRSKILDGTYPDYRRVIPGNKSSVVNEEEAKPPLLFSADALAAALNIVVSNWRDVRAVRFDLTKKECVLSQDGGTTSAPLDWKWPGLPFAIGFNPSYVRDILNVLGGEIKLTLFDPGSAAMWQRADGKGPLTVLMPMRI